MTEILRIADKTEIRTMILVDQWWNGEGREEISRSRAWLFILKLQPKIKCELPYKPVEAVNPMNMKSHRIGERSTLYDRIGFMGFYEKKIGSSVQKLRKPASSVHSSVHKS